MNIRSITLTLVLILFTGVVSAGTGHSHDPVDQQQAEQVASKVVLTLVERGVIEKSWGAIEVAKTEQKVFGGHPEWVVSYRNDAVSDPSKRTLYIFLTIAGEYLAANYTGQ